MQFWTGKIAQLIWEKSGFHFSHSSQEKKKLFHKSRIRIKLPQILLICRFLIQQANTIFFSDHVFVVHAYDNDAK